MEKPKIKSIKSKEYGSGRIDLFLVTKQDSFRKAIIGLLLDMGFTELLDFDSPYKDEELFIFGVYNNIKVYVIDGPSDDEIFLIFDSAIEKETLIKRMKKFFEIL